MQILPIDPRDTRWEVPHPTYRVYFWQRQQPHNPLSGWASDEWEIHDADIDEVLNWARDNAGEGGSSSMPGEDGSSSMPGLTPSGVA